MPNNYYSQLILGSLIQTAVVLYNITLSMADIFLLQNQIKADK